MPPAGGEVVDLSMHWVTNPVGVNGDNAVDKADEICAVDHVSSWIGV